MDVKRHHDTFLQLVTWGTLNWQLLEGLARIYTSSGNAVEASVSLEGLPWKRTSPVRLPLVHSTTTIVTYSHGQLSFGWVIEEILPCFFPTSNLG
jgi:hypothetical protein